MPARGTAANSWFSILNSHILPIAPYAFPSRSDTDLRQSGFHARLRLRPFEGFTLVAGGRISGFENKTWTRAPSPNPTFTQGAEANGKFTPSIGAVYYLTGDATVCTTIGLNGRPVLLRPIPGKRLKH